MMMSKTSKICVCGMASCAEVLLPYTMMVSRFMAVLPSPVLQKHFMKVAPQCHFFGAKFYRCHDLTGKAAKNW